MKKRRLWQGRHEDDSQLDALPTPEVRPPGEALRKLLAAESISPASRAVLLVFFRGATAMHSGNSNTAQAILAHYFILVIWVTALTLVVVIQITVMTKRILRAIELASKK